jgi:hypothetical protein
MTGVNIEHDDPTTGHAPASQRFAVRLLRAVWSALVDGAAMYGAAVHGYRSPDGFQYDVVPPTDNE